MDVKGEPNDYDNENGYSGDGEHQSGGQSDNERDRYSLLLFMLENSAE